MGLIVSLIEMFSLCGFLKERNYPQITQITQIKGGLILFLRIAKARLPHVFGWPQEQVAPGSGPG